MAKSVSILIVGDVMYDIEEVIRLSSAANHKIEYTKDSEYATELFERHKPRILILCFNKINDSEQFYLNLLAGSETAIDIPHQTILMCDGKDSKFAFNLTEKSLIDDYVIFKPLFDVNRLRLTIERLDERLKFIDVNKMMFVRLQSLLEELDGIKGTVINHDQDVKKIVADIKEHNNTVQTVVVSGIERVKERLSQMDSANKDNGVNGLAEFCDREISSEIKSVVEKSNVNAEMWAESVLEKYKNVIKFEEAEQKKDEYFSDSPLVMVVEDEQLNSNVMCMILEKEGYITIKAGDGIEAVKKADMNNPDIILMDIKMPRMNGLKAVCKIKENPKFSNVPIIMLSAHSEKAVVRECLRKGACDYIVKPASKEQLLERIAFHLTR